MKRLQWPFEWAETLDFVLRSGVTIRQRVLSYEIRHNSSDEVASTNFRWTGRQWKARLIRADQIAAVLISPRRSLTWRGFLASR